jgi:hypothetical protein
MHVAGPVSLPWFLHIFQTGRHDEYEKIYFQFTERTLGKIDEEGFHVKSELEWLR